MTDAKCPHCATPFRLGADLKAARDKIAELESRSEQVRDLAEAVLETSRADILDWQYVYTLATQLKEQQDAAS
jgi:succinate dehydrogenase/fumarate reductase flavoprotein subunit